MIAVVFWDIGGTLMHRKAAPIHYYRSLFQAYNIEYGAIQVSGFLTFVEEARKIIACQELKNIERELQQYQKILRTYITKDEQKIIAVAKEIVYEQKNFVVPAEAESILAYLAQHGIRQSVISNWAPSLLPLLDRYGLKKFFTHIVCSSIEGVAKPSEAIFRRALRLEGIKAKQALMIGDLPEIDIIPAKRLGMQTIHFAMREHSYDDLRGTLHHMLNIKG